MIQLSKDIKFLIQKGLWIFFHFNKYLRFRRMPVIIHSMGKVGSSTVFESLKKEIPFNRLFQVHFLNEENLEKIKDEYTKIQSYRALKALKGNRSRKVKIITLLRDPVARDISALSQNYNLIFGIEDVSKLSKQMCLQWLQKQDHNYPHRWFEIEFSEFWGIKIFDLPFDRHKHYEIYSWGEIDLLIFKMEHLNEVFEEGIKRFLNIDVTQKKENLSSQKKGSKLFQELRSEYVVPASQREKILKNGFMSHFYSDSEIESFIERWS